MTKYADKFKAAKKFAEALNRAHPGIKARARSAAYMRKLPHYGAHWTIDPGIEVDPYGLALFDPCGGGVGAGPVYGCGCFPKGFPDVYGAVPGFWLESNTSTTMLVHEHPSRAA